MTDSKKVNYAAKFDALVEKDIDGQLEVNN